MFKNITIAMLLFSVLLFFGMDAVADETHKEQKRQEDGFALFKLVKPLGIAALSFLLLTGVLGLLMWVKPVLRKKVIMIHRIAGILAILLGLSHAIIIFSLH